MACFGSPMPPPPAFYGNMRYVYHTRDGGPPLDGKPPSATAVPPPQYFALPGATPSPFGAPPCAFAAPPTAATQPGWMCWQQPSGPSQIFRPAPAPAGALGPPIAPPGPPPSYPSALAAAPLPGNREQLPAPGNRVNGRVARVDDGTGVLVAEEVTVFHVLAPGAYFQDSSTRVKLEGNFAVQACDSDWPVGRLVCALGGLTVERTGRKRQQERKVIEQWHEMGDGTFTRGTNIGEGDPRWNQSLRQVGWGPEHGKAGMKPPIWVMLYPVKGADD